MVFLHGNAERSQIEIMSGRYYRQSDKQKIAETFHVTRWAPDVHLAPDYISPLPAAPSAVHPKEMEASILVALGELAVSTAAAS